MSGWLFNAKSVILQLCHGENKLLFNEMMMFALYQTSPIHVHVHFVGFLLNLGGGRYNLWDFALIIKIERVTLDTFVEV